MKKNNTVSGEKVPAHVAFIMDGNRRWARAHTYSLLKGHKTGADRLESTVEFAAKRGIKYVTFWAFSTENWKRNKTEVALLIRIFRDVLSGPMVKRLIKNGVRLQVIGDYSVFSHDISAMVQKLIADSKQNTRITAVIALNYGGREEILRAVNELLREGKRQTVDEAIVSAHLYTAGQSDPDLIIRTGGEQRLSGYLPWQSIYSELYFTDTYWPDFDDDAFALALKEYARRERRFGK